jgi:hypothetical protein
MTNAARLKQVRLHGAVAILVHAMIDLHAFEFHPGNHLVQ